MYIDDFYAPYVEESEVKIGLKLIEETVIKSNNTILIVGEIVTIIIENNLVDTDGSLKFENMDSVCISGLDTYYETKKLAKYPYAKKI